MSSILKGLTESYSRDEENQQNAMDTRRINDLSKERNAGLDEPDELPTSPVETRNGVYEYNVPAGQENIAKDLGLDFHKGHWFSRVPVQRANFQFGRPQFHEIPSKNVSEAEQDYGPDYQDKVKRLGQMAKQGERKTVYDPVKRVYKTVPVNPSKEQGVAEDQLDELKCWPGHHRVAGTKAGTPGSCAKNKTNEESVAEGPEFDKWANDRAESQLHKLKPTTTWEVSFDYGPHQSDSVKVKASSEDEAIAKVEAAAEKKGRSIMVNWARPAAQGVAEGVAETLPMDDAVKVLRHYGAGHFKTTSNELHFYKQGRPFSVDLVMNPDATRSVTLSSLNSATRGLKGQGVAEGQHSCPHCGGEMVSEELMNEKKDACYYKVKSRYKVWPSAYASGALVKCRKSGADSWGNGGKKNESSILEGIEQVDENLHKWFKEKWVRFGPDGKIRGDCARGDDSEGKPKCLPQSKAQNLGKKGRASAASRKRREDPNPERSGKAINVNTKKKSNEGVAEGLRGTGNPGMPTPYDQGCDDAKKGRAYDNPYDQPGEEQEHNQYKKGYEQGKKQGVAEGYQDDSKEREENLRYARSRNPVADEIRKKLNPNQKPEKEQGVAEGTEQVYNILALDKGNALKKPTKLKWKASSLEDIFDALAAQDWYPLEINGVEVIAGKRLKQGVAEGVAETNDSLFSQVNELITTLKPEQKKQIADELRTELNVNEGTLKEKWSQKYKDSINCSNPKGFSQKAHCQGKKK